MDLQNALGELRRTLDVPAVGAALVDRDAPVEVEVVGVNKRGGEELVTTEDAWHLGSCTKSITALLYALLVERGEASFDTPVTELFADVAAVDGWESLTVTDLLHCRAGIQPNPSPQEMRRLATDESALGEQRSTSVAELLSRPPQSPGQFRYSNLSYVMVGAGIDRLVGEPYEDALERLIFEPLGITSHGFGPPSRICGHRRQGRLGRIFGGRARPALPDGVGSDNPPLFNPAGRLHLTMADWAAVQRVFLTGGTPLVSQASIDQLTYVPEPGAMAMGWVSAEGFGGSIAAQGSNTMWASASIVDADRKRAALVVANDGRSEVLTGTARFAAEMLGL